MARISERDVAGMFKRACAAAKALGADTTSWELHTGNSTNGISWKLVTPRGREHPPAAGLHLTGWSNEYLGSTRREAYDALHYLAMAWEAVASWGTVALTFTLLHGDVEDAAEAQQLQSMRNIADQLGALHTVRGGNDWTAYDLRGPQATPAMALLQQAAMGGPSWWRWTTDGSMPTMRTARAGA